ncbi:hypothetical protein FE257_004279 [Aspergillus nanangensis]|uniref:Zn(2)-C6 fungal-type domain-containing protein n=1 Tax=Aspergillus nanangensis TaxID=2582783 RepID=A0AAD4CTC6_ASPNN|nr:hypothetical protein FE257_004279 [Aspergillus nanangensis]
MTAESPTTRRISHANANRPPQNRRRVWRACESCRKKKVKCDGEDPCKPCSGYGIACTYPETARGSGVVASSPSADVFSSRLRSLEEMVAKLAQGQNNEDERRSDSVALSTVTTIPPEQRTVVDAPACQPAITTDDILNIDTSATQNLDFLDDLLTTAIDPSFWPSVPRPLPIQTYADCFGQLEVDTRGETRYVGLGASVCIVDNCAGLRKRIQSGLASKGFEPQESLLDSTPTSSPSLNAPSPIGWWAGELPPAALIDTLVDREYYRNTSRGSAESLGLLYAVLAVAASQIADPSDPVYNMPDCWRYQAVDVGAHFFSLAVTSLQSPATTTDLESSLGKNVAVHTVITRALLSVHLTQIGMPREAWKMLSHAVRLGQDMGLHRSPCKFHLPEAQQSTRRRIWWCLYVMDRLLSMNLGRPLAIEDADCDVEMPVPAEGITPGFIAMIRLCQIIGAVLRVSNSVGNAARWRDPANYPELRATVDEFGLQLSRWEREELANSRSNGSDPDDKQDSIESNVLRSTHISTLILLFRPLMSNPHRESPLGTEVAMRRCLEASTSCIHGVYMYYSADALYSVDGG